MSLYSRMILTRYRTPIRPSLREFRTFVVLSSLSTTPSLSALRTPIFQRDPSCLRSHLYQASSASCLARPSRCKEGNYYHGQRHRCNGWDTLNKSRPSAVPHMGTTLPVDLMIRRYVSGMSRLVPPSAIHYRVTMAVLILFLTPRMGAILPLGHLI